MHTVLFVIESSKNGSLCSERISGQQQGSCELGIDHCKHAWSDNCECCVLEQTARLSILGNYTMSLIINHRCCAVVN